MEVGYQGQLRNCLCYAMIFEIRCWHLGVLLRPLRLAVQDSGFSVRQSRVRIPQGSPK